MSEFLIDQGHQLRGGLPVAAVGRFEQARHVAHFGGSGRGVAS